MSRLSAPFAAAALGLATIGVAAAPVALAPEVAQRARANYLIQCAGCHLPDGHGAPGTVPDLREYLGVFAQHPAARPYIARVPGAAGSALSDAELTEVLNWILTTMNGDQLGPAFRPYTVEEVTRYRGDMLIDVAPVREALIRTVVAPAP
jgi:mono/diheme cytochrome c family protein